MKAYKITLLFIDFDHVGKELAAQLIEDAILPNHINPGKVIAIKECDIGEWSDDHPLNSPRAQVAEVSRLFGQD